MQEKIDILIADDNIEFGDILREYLNDKEGLNVVGVARDGREAIDKAEATQPDVILLDIVMPEYDGLVVLEKIMALNLKNRPAIIMLTAIGQDAFIKNAVKLGAEYYVVKPFDVDVLEARIRQIYLEKETTLFTKSGKKETGKRAKSKKYNGSLQDHVTKMIQEFGIPPHISGYHYIREAVIMVARIDKPKCMITKEIYPAIAKKMNTTAQKVERSIRNAISNAWSSYDGNNIRMFEGCRPSNAKFIFYLADMVKENK